MYNIDLLFYCTKKKIPLLKIEINLVENYVANVT